MSPNRNSPKPENAAPSSSLYETGGRTRREEAQFTERPLRNPFIRPTANRRINALLALATLACIGITGGLLYTYNQPPVTPARHSRRAHNPPSVSLTSSALEVPLSPSTALLADELADLQPLAPPAGGPAPLNVTWLKQAAYYLVMGEKAYAEDRLTDALQHFSQALRIYPQLKGVHRYLGMIHLKLKNYDRAAHEFELVGREEGLSAGVANNIGIAYLALNMFDEAEKYLKQSVALDPEYATAYLNLATLARRRKQPSLAAEYFRRYLELRPNDLAAAQAYASLLMDLNRWEEAIPWLERIRNASPELAPVYFRLAVSLAHTGHKNAAFSAINRGIQLVDPQKALAWLSEPDFDPLRRDPRFRQVIATLSTHAE